MNLKKNWQGIYE